MNKKRWEGSSYVYRKIDSIYRSVIAQDLMQKKGKSYLRNKKWYKRGKEKRKRNGYVDYVIKLIHNQGQQTDALAQGIEKKSKTGIKRRPREEKKTARGKNKVECNVALGLYRH